MSAGGPTHFLPGKPRRGIALRNRRPPRQEGVGDDIFVAIRTAEFYTVVLPPVGFFSSGNLERGYVWERPLYRHSPLEKYPRKSPPPQP
jgi:hypothetical protein